MLFPDEHVVGVEGGGEGEGRKVLSEYCQTGHTRRVAGTVLALGLHLLDVAGRPGLRAAHVGDEVRHLGGGGGVRGYGEHCVLAGDGAD